jgi:hypothetical protein
MSFEDIKLKKIQIQSRQVIFLNFGEADVLHDYFANEVLLFKPNAFLIHVVVFIGNPCRQASRGCAK